MTGTTRLFGLILIVLAIASYQLTGRTSITALIPAFVGAVFLICSMAARKEAARKHAMHAAVAVGLIGAIGALARGIPAAINGDRARPAVIAQLAMGILLLIYVALGVRSFIAARKARMAGSSSSAD
jgi:nitrate/nitrite transporter NarK